MNPLQSYILTGYSLDIYFAVLLHICRFPFFYSGLQASRVMPLVRSPIRVTCATNLILIHPWAEHLAAWYKDCSLYTPRDIGVVISNPSQDTDVSTLFLV